MKRLQDEFEVDADARSKSCGYQVSFPCLVSRAFQR